MLTLPVKLMAKQQCMHCIVLSLPVKLMAKQQCMRCIDVTSACETNGQTTMYALY